MPGRVAQILRRGLRLRCPRCGTGALFERWLTMRPACAACGLSFEREAGYWVGAIYVNYALTVALALGGYFALAAWTTIGTGAQVALWSAFVIVFPFGSFRHSKALWLALDHLMDPVEPGAGR